MKKRLLMPFLVAGMIVVSALSLDSCKKNQDSGKEVFDSGEAPMVEAVVYGDRDLEYICPYCGESIAPNTTDHWHAFGTPRPDCSYSGPTPYDVDYCTIDLSHGACPYSGKYQHDENAIAWMMSEYSVDRETAIEMLKPRFHGHNLTYVLFGPDGGQLNSWHVGGGVPFWPCPNPQP